MSRRFESFRWLWKQRWYFYDMETVWWRALSLYVFLWWCLMCKACFCAKASDCSSLTLHILKGLKEGNSMLYRSADLLCRLIRICVRFTSVQFSNLGDTLFIFLFLVSFWSKSLSLCIWCLDWRQFSTDLYHKPVAKAWWLTVCRILAGRMYLCNFIVYGY